MRESAQYAPVEAHHVDESRPSIGFPLGTAVLVIVMCGISGIFTCCYHCHKLRSPRHSFLDGAVTVDLDSPHDSSPHKSDPNSSLGYRNEEKESVTVVMPGEHIPTFIALPCPRQPPRHLHPAHLSTATTETMSKPPLPLPSP